MYQIPPYNLIRSNRRTLSMSIASDKVLVVRAPMRAPISYIESFLVQKQSWIEKVMKRISFRPLRQKHQFISGETFLYLGKEYILEVTSAKVSKVSFDEKFILTAPTKSKAKELFTKWYIQSAQQIISERARSLALIHGYSYKSLKITSATKRWGSCTTRGTINFTWRLVMAPLWVIDYVICHELAHLHHPNHSRAFWSEVTTIYPDHLKAQEWLKYHANLLTL